MYLHQKSIRHNPSHFLQEKTGIIVIKIGFSYICNMRQERKETILSETGKFLVDIAKLVFGGIILAGIMKYESINSVMLYSVGGIAVIICFLSGLILLTRRYYLFFIRTYIINSI